jgi:hypothetical protein
VGGSTESKTKAKYLFRIIGQPAELGLTEVRIDLKHFACPEYTTEVHKRRETTEKLQKCQWQGAYGTNPAIPIIKFVLNSRNASMFR